MTEPTVPPDLEIAQAATIRPIFEVAATLGIDNQYLIPYGRDKAKVHLDILRHTSGRPAGKFIDVTAVTPTPLGEGKTTTSIGLVQGLGRLGHKAIAAVRQPSLGLPSGSKVVAPAAGTARSFRWRTSISISPETSMRWRRPTT